MDPTLIELLSDAQLQALRATCNIKKPGATAAATSFRAYLDLQLIGMVIDLEIARRAAGGKAPAAVPGLSAS